MKHVFALMMFLMTCVASAEVLTAYDAHENVAPISRDGALFVKCMGCNDAMRNRIIQKLETNGFVTTGERSSAKYIIVFASKVTIPDNGKTRYVYSEEAYGLGIPPIAPAINMSAEMSNRNLNPDSSSGLSAGETSILLQAAHTFGAGTSYAGGIGIAIVANILASLIGNSIIDSKRKPGVANALVTVVSDEKKSSFSIIAAATTPETPDALIDATIDKAIEGIVNGVPNTRGVKEASNAR